MSSKSYNIFTKTLMAILVFLMIAGVAVWGINDILIGSRNKVIAKVGNSKISSSELDSMVQNRKMQLMNSGISNFSDELTTILTNNALVNLIADRLMQDEFTHLNLQLDDKEVLKHDYLSQPDFDKDRLKAFARSAGGEEAFLHKVSKDKKTDFLQGALTASDLVLSTLSQGIYGYENQTRNFDYIEMDVNFVKDVGNPTEAELQDFYEKNKDNFISPEYRSVSYIILDKSIIKDQKDVVSQLHDISNQILDKVAGGATLEEVAKEYGTEIKKLKPVNTTGELESGAPSTELPKIKDFLAAVFATEQSEISDMLESDNGNMYAFVRVDEIKDKRIKALDEVRNIAIEGLKVQNRAKKLVEISKKLKEDLDKKTTTLADFAAKNGLKVQQKSDAGIKNKEFSPEFISNIFGLKVGEYSDLNKTGGNKIIIGKLTGVNASKQGEALQLLEYKSKIQDQISQEIMAQYLDYLREKYNVIVYSK